MRSLYPFLWIATLGLAGVLLLRPGGLGTLLALATHWDGAPWSDSSRLAGVRGTVESWAASGPIAPGASARPSAWPGVRRLPAPSSESDSSEVQPAAGVGDDETRTMRLGPAQSSLLPPRDDRQLTAPSPPPNDRPFINPPPPGNRPFADPLSDVELPLGSDRQAVAPPVAASAGRPPEENAIPCEGAEILARVGSEIILAGELMAGIPEMRAKNAHVPKDILEAKIREILKQRLDQKIDEKLVCQHAQRTIPADNFPKIKDNLAKEFEHSQVPRMMKNAKANTRQELDEMLHAAGSSLELQKRAFIEQVLAHEWIKQQVKVEEDVGHEEMVAYYRTHASEFETPARARWEQLTVRVARYSSRQEAYEALARMGNQVLDGVPLAEVAKAHSHGATAEQGGYWDWTTRGSLASDVLDRAIFGDGTRPGLPVGALSPILEDDQSLHIIRVIERQEARRTPFLEAQVEIRKKIRNEREARARQAYLAKLRRETPIWTAFDTPVTATRPSVGRYVE